MKDELRPISNQRILPQAIRAAVLQAICEGVDLGGESPEVASDCVADVLRLRRFNLPVFQERFGRKVASTGTGWKMLENPAFGLAVEHICILVKASVGEERLNTVTHWDYEELQFNDWRMPKEGRIATRG